MEFWSTGLYGSLFTLVPYLLQFCQVFFRVSLGGSVNQTPLLHHFRAKDISNNFLPLITIHTKICKLLLNIILKVLFTGQENGTRKMGCQSVLNCFVSVTADT